MLPECMVEKTLALGLMCLFNYLDFQALSLEGATWEDDAMAEDWSVDVKKYAPNADPKAIAGIVRYLGIALQKRDSSLVAFSDKEEVARVRTKFLKKKLGLTNPDAELDKAITAISEKMKADRTKNRVTVYYLLADHFGKLSLFS